MKITMISNYINHHQIPFSNALYERMGDNYTFIQTEPMEEERVKMGWGVDITNLPYVKLLYQEKESVIRDLIDYCDILLVGWMEREDLLVRRLSKNRLTIRISERLYREGQYKAVSPRGLVRKYLEHTRYRDGNVFLLCAGAYVPSDFHIVRAYPNKMYRFGYFPDTRIYEGNTLFDQKPPLTTIHIVWAGRLIPLKHPEFVTRLAKDLKRKRSDISFHIHLIGDGEMKSILDERIETNNLSDCITMYGFMAPDKVRDMMEKCHIHLFTSNHLEGWGAVVNEGMNSGLAEVVNSEVGAAPFLIQNEKNGLIYKQGSYKDFFSCVCYLMDHKEKITEFGKNAYQTIITEWNATHAVDELFAFYKGFLCREIKPPLTGPFSEAPVISPRKMYRNIK